MYRISAVCASQAATLLLHWMMMEYSPEPYVNALLMAPSIVFLLGCSVFIMVFDMIPTFILHAYSGAYQFFLQLFSSFLFLNACLYAIWYNVENFIHVILPKMVEEMVSLSAEGKWYGLVHIDEKVWTTCVALMLSFVVLAMISSKVHFVDKGLTANRSKKAPYSWGSCSCNQCQG